LKAARLVLRRWESESTIKLDYRTRLVDLKLEAIAMAVFEASRKLWPKFKQI
jgi:hypothetical protein